MTIETDRQIATMVGAMKSISAHEACMRQFMTVDNIQMLSWIIDLITRVINIPHQSPRLPLLRSPAHSPFDTLLMALLQHEPSIKQYCAFLKTLQRARPKWPSERGLRMAGFQDPQGSESTIQSKSYTRSHRCHHRHAKEAEAQECPTSQYQAEEREEAS